MIPPRQAFVVLRHGETDANRDRIIAGRSEAQLTPAGRSAARALAQWHWPVPLRLFVSPQQRAADTAALAFPDHSAQVLSGLRERDWGVFEGQPVGNLPPREATPRDGEPWADMVARVDAALGVALDQSAADQALAVLVAHSGVIRALRLLCGASPHGPSPHNTTPYLFVRHATGWHEHRPDKKDKTWIV
ncbi:bifunctional RNase H/acid phosphatase [Aquimixticola soesokkakensis]|uniref:Bifunctional RNase H/acid phosphatase n=1 Tax=Aquimixticola soesokkakensis TaxID=1519096 RepID=A0A1Y5SMY2_9RHOB|nr:histidine phosphatase family protein [Aquimixticola soesokkakensis]SLN41331.1 bifunctional RNase H/acid phosphatase [Aquimixticola soesokkakensis]